MENTIPATMETQKELTTETRESDVLSKVIQDRDDAIRFQAARHSHWTENYDLARDIVSNNRLLQRHPVNMPLMKENEQAYLGKMTDVPNMYFQCIHDDPDVQAKKELLINEYWEDEMVRMDLPVMDFLGKKNVYYTGRTVFKLGLQDRQVTISPMDPFDVVLDPKMKPWDIESARHIHHLNIFKPLGAVLSDKRYTGEGRRKLRAHLATSIGIQQAGMAADQLAAKLLRLADMGFKQFLSEMGREKVVTINESIDEIWDAKQGKYVRHVITYAFNTILLRKVTLKDAMGTEFMPYETWASSPDTSVLWDVGPADGQRTLNKVENIWMSQLLENRTLRNYGMNFFDSTNQSFNPQSYTPKPFGFYPVPGDPNKIIKSVGIADMTESLDEMEYLRNMASRVIAVTDINKGISSPGDRTKAESELLFEESYKPVSNQTKFYTAFWRRLADKWYKLKMANLNTGDKTTLQRRGKNGVMYSYDMKLSEIQNKRGYNIKVMSREMKDQQTNQMIKKLQAVKSIIGPNNAGVNMLVNEKILRELDVFSPRELKEVIDMLNEPAQPMIPGQPVAPGVPNI